ncbi:copper resistance protein CopC [Psychromonas sp.]|uniref:copper resistance CopC family protein n=1 Tax=Psychromonas sp. TaxID=1884585 RepID=UPI00356A0300
MKIFNIIIISSLLILSSLASAHSRLKYSIPKYGAVLNESPDELLLEFSTQVKIVKLQLIDQSGKALKLKTEPSKAFESTFTIALPMLNSGSYEVKWVVMARDTHKMKGDFPFTVHTSAMGITPAILDKQNHDHD